MKRRPVRAPRSAAFVAALYNEGRALRSDVDAMRAAIAALLARKDPR